MNRSTNCATGPKVCEATKWHRASAEDKTVAPYGWIHSIKGLRLVRYRLPQVLAEVAAGGTVFVPEGEKDVEALERDGHVATCNPMGAGEWQPEFADLLAGPITAIVVADKDTPGAKHANTVYASLDGRVRHLRMVEARIGKDVAEHLGAGLGVGELVVTRDSAEPAGDVGATDIEVAGDYTTAEESAEEPKGSQATVLVQLALQRYSLGRSEEGDEPFAVPNPAVPNVARMLRGDRSIRTELASVFYQTRGKAPTGSALSDTLAVLEGMAMECEPQPVALRVARHDGGPDLDLGRGDGTVAVITPAGWYLTELSPVLFRRTKAMSALPLPDVAGDMQPLRKLINVGEDGWQLIVAWLIAALFPDIAHVVLFLLGEQGTAKSWAGKMCSAVIDPSPAQLRRAPTDAVFV